MAYKKDWRASPNFTPASQTKAFYGQPRVIKGGAGHWWNWPRSGARHDGIVSYMAQPSRQAAPHAVLSAGRVTEMVKDKDTAWCTGRANPYTFAIEVDPRIMFKWGYDNPSKSERALGNQIFETLAEYIADKKYHGIPWKAHNVWAPGTQCNPIRYSEVISRAKAIYKAKYEKPKAPAIKWVTMDKPRKMVATENVRVYDLKAKKYIGDTIKKGTVVDFKTKTPDSKWLRSAYSTSKKLNQGLQRGKFTDPEPPKPEWLKNLKDIKPAKLMVLTPQTDIVHLENLNIIKKLGRGTYVDFTKKTTVKGIEYLLSAYSVKNGMPNGIRSSDVGLPAEPPVQEKPEWLENWQDIADKVMYARADIQVVNLLDGTTVTTVKRGAAVDIASATTWLDTQYLITKYSTDNKKPYGIALVDLADKPIENPEQPVEPAPEQPSLEERVTILEKLVEKLREALAKLGINI